MPEGVWLAMCYALKGVNYVLSFTSGSNPSATKLLDTALTLDILRVRQGR